MPDKSTRFLHQQNEDGAFDSICRTCLATVACSLARAELAENQEAHVCNSAFLAERGCLSRAESTYLRTECCACGQYRPYLPRYHA